MFGPNLSDSLPMERVSSIPKGFANSSLTISKAVLPFGSTLRIISFKTYPANVHKIVKLKASS